ncbi:hypothetical protein HK096_009645, partial [Nowakowskiella sp. JEL0078]
NHSTLNDTLSRESIQDESPNKKRTENSPSSDIIANSYHTSRLNSTSPAQSMHSELPLQTRRVRRRVEETHSEPLTVKNEADNEERRKKTTRDIELDSSEFVDATETMDGDLLECNDSETNNQIDTDLNYNQPASAQDIILGNVNFEERNTGLISNESLRGLNENYENGREMVVDCESEDDDSDEQESICTRDDNSKGNDDGSVDGNVKDPRRIDPLKIIQNT